MMMETLIYLVRQYLIIYLVLHSPTYHVRYRECMPYCEQYSQLDKADFTYTLEEPIPASF